MGLMLFWFAPALVPISMVFLLNSLLIGVLFTASLNLIMGYGRMISFGHAAYYALGAYGMAIMVIHAHWSPALAIVLSPLLAAIGAGIIGFFCTRSSGAYFIMLTLAFAQLLYTVIFQWYSLTHGQDGLSGIFMKGWLGSPTGIYQFSVLVVAACLLFLWWILRSPFGYALRAVGANPERAAFLGLPERRYRWYAFVLAGFLAGIAGMLFAMYNGSVSPGIAYWTQSAAPFIAIIVGGMSSFVGPLVGSALLSVIGTEAASYTHYSSLLVGLVALAVGLFLRQGLAGLVQRRGRRHGRE